MGLFGYSKRTYAKNTVLLTVMLDELIKKLPEDSGVYDRALRDSAESLRCTPCPKVKGSDLEAIDEYLFYLRDAKIAPALESKHGALSVYVDMLAALIIKCRRKGMIRYSRKLLDEWCNVADLRGDLIETLSRMEAARERMLEMRRMASSASADGSDDSIRRRYDEIAEEYEGLCDATSRAEEAYKRAVTLFTSSAKHYGWRELAVYTDTRLPDTEAVVGVLRDAERMSSALLSDISDYPVPGPDVTFDAPPPDKSGFEEALSEVRERERENKFFDSLL